MPNPVKYVSELLPVSLAEAEPPKPVESSHSRPQKGAKYNVTYTLYPYSKWVHAMGRIPIGIRGSSKLRKGKTNSDMRGRAALSGSSVVVRVIPSSYSDRMTS